MKQWELVRYLIDSKKVVDSLDYIQKNKDKLSNLDLYTLIYEKQLRFYITLCIFLDNCFKKSEIKNLKKEDNVINSIYYQRDKNYAHKDQNYIKTEYSCLDDLVLNNKNLVDHVYKLTKKLLPKDFNIDYVCHDKNLYRLINGIKPETENMLKSLMYPEQKNYTDNLIKEYKALNDTEDFKYITNPDEYGVTIECGVNIYESLQNFQDSLIKINVLFDQNIWVEFKTDTIKEKLEYINESLLNITNEILKQMNNNNDDNN